MRCHDKLGQTVAHVDTTADAHSQAYGGSQGSLNEVCKPDRKRDRVDIIQGVRNDDRTFPAAATQR